MNSSKKIFHEHITRNRVLHILIYIRQLDNLDEIDILVLMIMQYTRI